MNSTINNFELDLFPSDLNNALYLEQITATIERQWNNKKKMVSKLLCKENQRAFNFDLKFILNMKRIAEKAKELVNSELNQKWDIFGLNYQQAVAIIFKGYRKWKKNSMCNIDNIPSYVFIQE